MVNINIIENKLIKLMKKAEAKGEVPISALIVYNDKIIATAYNKVEKTNNVMNHAEIIVIKKSMKKLKNWRLDECKLYVSLEPCSMCKEVIKKSRIKEVYYFSSQNSERTEKNIKMNFIENKYMSDQLKNFFKRKR